MWTNCPDGSGTGDSVLLSRRNRNRGAFFRCLEDHLAPRMLFDQVPEELVLVENTEAPMRAGGTRAENKS